MNHGPASIGARLSVMVATCFMCEFKIRGVRRGGCLWFCSPTRGKIIISNLISSSPALVVRVWRPLLRRRVRGFSGVPGHGGSAFLPWRGRDSGGFFSPFLIHPLPVPFVFLPQTLAAAAGSCSPHPLPVEYPDPGRSRQHPPQPATSGSSQESARAPGGR
jgi:hypothetical protein